MEVEVIEALIILANECKDYRLHEIANVLFRHICEKIDRDTSLLEKGVSFEIESEASWFWISKTYYDLAVIVARDERLCIPVPLVDPMLLCAFMKVAKVVERWDHDREYKELTAEVKDSLYKDIIKLLPEEVIEEIANLDCIENLD